MGTGTASVNRLLGLHDRRTLVEPAERWRPWRSYATQVLWGMLDHPITQRPGDPPVARRPALSVSR